ncbi:hypothetical protein P153DRAFT_371657 [Dothidotthia symphoricarpi CBS 119687]|uniref:Uncharacterized protein n=1 Tax=Dothidotthia symphoricarpi CBS 119687 TaxID=1392245 RepID=A0A6A5ZUY6_9PLEO|nr:uncharacterized protein P153DRAFT_371657 [Dothidotthia symphoricarpi CBS 119687]KAF2123460.1 hypothetical protein P153DRAFT_371657 [Dothidotthia symphoricarpi CBS 119687]
MHIKTLTIAVAMVTIVIAAPIPLHHTNTERLPNHPASTPDLGSKTLYLQSHETAMITGQGHVVDTSTMVPESDPEDMSLSCESLHAFVWWYLGRIWESVWLIV